MNADFLATYGEWNIQSFLTLDLGTRTTLVLLQVRRPGTGDEATAEIGRVVRQLWQDTTSMFPTAHGHRTAWGDLAFVVRTEEARTLAEPSATIAAPRGSACNIWATAAAFPEDLESRQLVLEDISWRLSKVDYRKEYPGLWFVRNGRVEHQ
jgi:hypothetical protein